MKEEVNESVTPFRLSALSGERTRLEILIALFSETLLREVGALESNDEINSLREIDLAKEIESYEADLIRNALKQTGGIQRQAARLLNVKTTTLNAKIKRYRMLERHK